MNYDYPFVFEPLGPNLVIRPIPNKEADALNDRYGDEGIFHLIGETLLREGEPIGYETVMALPFRWLEPLSDCYEQAWLSRQEIPSDGQLS